MLRLEDKWIWDSWPFSHGGQHHLFFLQAPRSLGDPELRHRNVSVGHAVSTDWRTWTVLPDAIAPGQLGSWDDGATWTGSVVQGPDGRFHLFYTGARIDEGHLVQRIGRADSEDLVTWTKLPDPLLEVDTRWYEKYDGKSWHDEACRDPWVVADPDGDGWHMLYTARAIEGDPRGRGVIGHAWSPDLDRWEAREPLSSPAGFGHLEVPQYFRHGDDEVLLFSCALDSLVEAEHPDWAEGGVWVVPGSGQGPAGPWDISQARPLPCPNLYAGHLVDDGGTPALLGFAKADELGGRPDDFGGYLADPVPVDLTARA